MQLGQYNSAPPKISEDSKKFLEEVSFIAAAYNYDSVKRTTEL
jgi:hypothetical protein